MDLPTISIVIPTLNSVKTLGKCLDSILIQEYPKERIEIIIADGGSIDSTLEIVKSKLARPRYYRGAPNYQILTNPLRTGEAGKAVGVKVARNDVIVLIDSDNILPQNNWLMRMVEPFQEPEIIASEPIYYTYRPVDGFITRYCALLGMNDPICMWLGNYDRYCILTGMWTEVIHNEEDKGNYLKVKFPVRERLPTIGANGFCIRRSLLHSEDIGNYLFDIDILYGILGRNNKRIAKVNIGIVHIFSGTTYSFIKKQTRRVRDYSYYKSLGLRRYAWGNISRIRILKFVFDTILCYPLLVQGVKGYLKKRDLAWFFHPVACWLTLIVYFIGMMKSLIGVRPHSRERWEGG